MIVRVVHCSSSRNSSSSGVGGGAGGLVVVVDGRAIVIVKATSYVFTENCKLCNFVPYWMRARQKVLLFRPTLSFPVAHT